MKDGKKWGYVNSKNILIIPAIFDEVYAFENKYAVVKMNGLYGVINSSGKMFIEPNYDQFVVEKDKKIFKKAGASFLLNKANQLVPLGE